MKTYAIGDVHGRADLLYALLSFIRRDNESEPAGYRVIFLGDIIDRGPDSLEAMDLVVEELARHSESRLILGNHEEFLLLFLDRPDKRELVFDHWMRNGGLAAAASYGLDVSRRFERVEDAHESLLERLTTKPDHVAAMRDAVSIVTDKRHLFVHAGLRPGVSVGEQNTKDLRTIRKDFLTSDYDFGRVVVHGHTITQSLRPEVHRHRIALDTGAERSGRLTAMLVDEGGEGVFLQTVGGAVAEIEPEHFR